MKIKAIILITYWLAIFFLLYAVGKILAVVIDIFFLDSTFTLPKYETNFQVEVDKTRNLDEFSSTILGNIFDTEPAPEGILETQDLTSNIGSIELTGIFVWPNITVVITKYNNKTYIVQAGETIPETTVKLEKAERSRALFSTAGIERWVELKRSHSTNTTYSSNSSRNSSTSSNSSSQSNTPNATNQQATGGIQILPQQGNKQDVLVSRDRLENELQNFAQFLNQARVFPHFEDGQPSGYVIRNIEKNSVYEQLGLKNEDIIKTVNGQTIDSPERAFELFKLLRNEKLVRLSLVRKQTPLDFEFHIN